MKNIQLLAALSALVSGDIKPENEMSFGYEKLIAGSKYTPRPVKKKTLLKAKGKKK